MNNRAHLFLQGGLVDLFKNTKKTNSCHCFIPISLLFLLFCLIPISNANCEVILNFGVYASDKPSAMVKQFRPLLNLLETEMSRRLDEKVKIKLKIASDYEKGIEGIVRGTVDFSRLGPVSYIEAKKRNKDVSILALESKKGTKSFLGVVCVHTESAIKNIAELKGKSFAFGNKLSTIGRYLAQQDLIEHGIRASDLSSFSYLGRHDKVGAAVDSKLYDAGALKESTYKKLVSKGAKLKIIGTFPNVTKPWVARSELEPSIYNFLKESLLGIIDKNALKSLGKDGFLPGDDSDFFLIRKAINNNPLFFNRKRS